MNIHQENILNYLSQVEWIPTEQKSGESPSQANLNLVSISPFKIKLTPANRPVKYLAPRGFSFISLPTSQNHYNRQETKAS